MLSMAVHADIAAVVLAEIGDDPVMVVDIVRDELEFRCTQTETAQLAQTALADLPEGWLAVDSEQWVTLEAVKTAQADVADGRPLKSDSQHWAESVIIAMCRASGEGDSTRMKVLLSEDYDARRVAARAVNTTGVSVHGLIHNRVQGNHLSAERAGQLADLLKDAGRGPEVSAEDFADPTGRKLGRVGLPKPSI